MHKSKRKGRTAKIPKPIKVKKEKIEEERTPQSMALHMDDRLELVKQIFGTLKPKTIVNLAPDFLKSKRLEEIEEACLNELLCVSSKRLKSIITATKCPTDTESSDTNSDVERDEELISLEEISSGSEIEGNSSKKGEDGQISVLELLELQARARAIRSQLALEPVTKIEVDSDENTSKSRKTNKTIKETQTSNELKRSSSGQESQKSIKQSKANISGGETFKTNIQLINQTERRKKIKLKRNYRCTSAQDLNTGKGESIEKSPDEEKPNKDNEKQKDYNQESTKIFIKQEKKVRRSLSPDVIPIILEAETLLISDSSDDDDDDLDDEYTENKNPENSFEKKEEDHHKEISKESNDKLSTKEKDEEDKNYITNNNNNNNNEKDGEEGTPISIEKLEDTVKNEVDHNFATISGNTKNMKIKDDKQNANANNGHALIATKEAENSQLATTTSPKAPAVKTTPLSISDEDDDERNDDVISLEGGDLENEMIEHLQNDASNTNSSFAEMKSNIYDEEQKSQDDSQPDDVISLDSSDDEHRKNAESWHSRYIKSSKVSRVLAASRLSKRVRDRIKKSKSSKKNASRENLNMEKRESTPDFKSRHEDGSVEQYKELLELRQRKS
uniref:Uncharacterized protein n=1 Tax=Glossina brevipalpis TaxID=37001 RepID=A0A1A9WEA8_9MUSC